MFFDLLCIAAADISLQKLIGTKARWFQLHAFVNMIVTILSFQDLVFTMTDPLAAITQYCDRQVSVIVFSLHLYHLVAFKKLTRMDYMHHFISAFVVGGPSIFLYYNKLLNASNFFICGLPGFINYACLTGVKHGKIKKITEKRINSFLNIYMRQPGILYTVVLNYIAYRYDYDPNTPSWLFVIAGTVLFWNANFFSYEAIYNYGNKMRHR